MASGNRRIRINTQERAVSTDINRLQAFQNADMAEIFRAMLNTLVSSEDDALGTESAPNTVETPLRAEILAGLLVKPQAASLNLLVDPGTAYFMAPDAVADDSNYKFINDAGIANTGVLLMTANSSGSTRIDVIECRINPTEAIVTDSRDIFNVSTGLFSAATVTKELKGRLEYRVRAGTPGSGMPANQSGWLPLCVASVPNGTTTNDTITFWDVRPMIADRPNLMMHPRTGIGPLEFNGALLVSGSNAKICGHIVGEHKGRKIGGRLRKGTPGTDVDEIEAKSASTEQEPGTTTGSSLALHFYLVFPFSLPRWARYTDGPTGRVPRSTKGILVVSNTGPADFSNVPSAALTLPTSTGLGSTTTTDAVCFLSVGSAGTSTVPQVHVAKNIVHSNGNMTGSALSSANDVVGDASLYRFRLTHNVQYPANAKRLKIIVFITKSVAADTNVTFAAFTTSPSYVRVLDAVYDGSTTSLSVPSSTYVLQGSTYSNAQGTSQDIFYRGEAWIEVPTKYPSAPHAFDVFVSTISSPDAVAFAVTGWET